VKRLASLIVVLALLLAAAFGSVDAGPAAAGSAVLATAPPPVFVVTGGGSGHGVGMSQWGARGQALAGRGYQDILATYYPGTTLGRLTKNSVRVMVGDRVRSAAFAATGSFVVTDGGGRTFPLAAGPVEIPATLLVQVGSGGEATQLVPPVTLRPRPGTTIAYAGVARRGSFVVTRASNRLLVVNTVKMDGYLRGVVPAEVPASWPAEALKAQAVAARTYAATRLAPGNPYDLTADVMSQVYGGIPAESDTTDRAVAETAGQIVSFGGAPAQTPYFSSSGGRTASARDIFGNDFPYLVAVDDPWDAASPLHRWPPRTLTAAALGKAVGLPEPAADVVPVGALEATDAVSASAAPPTPFKLRVVGRRGAAVDLSRADLRARLGLASTAFRLGILALSVTQPSAGPGSPVQLSGTVRDVETPVLERRRADGSWKSIRALTPLADGTIAVVVRPAAETVFRLSGSGQPGPAVTVAVLQA
jgi:stage II sporulation protein D